MRGPRINQRTGKGNTPSGKELMVLQPRFGGCAAWGASVQNLQHWKCDLQQVGCGEHMAEASSGSDVEAQKPETIPLCTPAGGKI